MKEHNVGSILAIEDGGRLKGILTENGKLVGMVAMPDIAAVMKDQFDQFISLEEAYARH